MAAGSHPREDALDQCRHTWGQQFAGLQHFFMAGLGVGIDLVDRHVADTGYAQHPHSAVPSDDDLRHGRHSDRVGADQAQKADICRGLVRRPSKSNVHALV